MRIQYEISADFWNRMKRYAPSARMRHETAAAALEEWVTRREGRDKKHRQEQLESDVELLKPVIQKMFDDGEVKIG